MDDALEPYHREEPGQEPRQPRQQKHREHQQALHPQGT